MGSGGPSSPATLGIPALTTAFLREQFIRVRRRFPSAYFQFGSGSRIRKPILSLGNPAGIALGENVTIQSYAIIQAAARPGRAPLSIGDATYVGYFCRITAVESVTIGRNVMISDRVYISDAGHNYEDISRPISSQGLRTGRRVLIGDGAWIGIGAAIVGNVKIGEGAVVGANSLVREDVAEHTVVSGNPARVVRYYDGSDWRSVLSKEQSEAPELT